MKQKTKLILFGTVFAIMGTIYAFSGYQCDNVCKSLLALGNECTGCQIGENCTNTVSSSFTFSTEPNLNFAKVRNTLLDKFDDREVSFFNVPLVCNAAPTIGCGSRAKPVLKSFENSPNVKEAWLNKAGTTIAVVWNEGLDIDNKKQTANTIFSEHKLNATEISTEEYSNTIKSFELNEGWLKGSDVDKLSKEEAAIFAKRITKTIKENTDLSAAHLEKVEQKVSDGFYDFFINYKSISDLGNPDSYKAVLKDVISYGNELAGEDVMPSLETLWSSCSNISNTSKSCCSTGKSCSTSCKGTDDKKS